MPPNPQGSHSRIAQRQRPPNTSPPPQPQHLQVIRQPTPLEARIEREVQQPMAMSNSNAQQAKATISGATTGLQPARVQPLSGNRNTKYNTYEGEPRVLVMREGRRVAVESQHQEAQSQDQQSADDSRYEDPAVEPSPQQIQHRSTTARAAESPVVSGPQSMLNMFKFRADAAVKASGDNLSFTDRKSHPTLMMLCLIEFLADIEIFG